MLYLHLCTLTVLAFILSACGGGSSNSDPRFPINVSVSGLTGILELGVNDSRLSITSNGEFDTEDTFEVGRVYQITVEAQPEGQTCTIDNASGVVTEDGVEPLLILCEAISHELRGSAFGLSGELVLDLRSGDLLESLSVTNTDFSFLTSLVYASQYSVVISQQPTAQTCSLSQSEGQISNEAPDTVVVQCEDIEFSLVGEAFGLKGSASLLLESGSKSELLVVEEEQFSFDTSLLVGEAYDVSLNTSPAGQSCALTNASGTVQITGADEVLLSCTDNIYIIAGAASGLDSSLELRLITDQGAEIISVSNGAFSFTSELHYGDGYTVDILEQPEGQSCSLSNGSDVIGDVAPLISVACTTTFPVTGITTGLTGSLSLSLIAAAPQEGQSRPSNAELSSETILEEINVSVESFSFQQVLEVGSSYEVAVVEQPENQVCSLSDHYGVVSSSGISVVQVMCEHLSTSESTLSGRISYPANVQFDSDINDPSTPLVDNSTFSNAQQIPNIVTIQGFATATSTGNEGDHFENQSDINDYYRVNLQAGQGLRLQVVNYEQFDAPGMYHGDLDLYLYDENLDIVAYSNALSEFEEITVADIGEYYVEVFAYSGASKYVLNIVGSGASSALNKSVDFIPDEAVIKMNTPSGNRIASSSSLAMSLNHQEKGRATLAKFASMSSFSQASVKTKIEELAALNPDSYAKFKTLNRIKALNLEPEISFAEPNYIRQPYIEPNDEFYRYQWHYPAMKLPQAWDISTGYSSAEDDDVVVAVIDTGVYLDHTDLDGQLVPGYDFISDPENALDGDGIDNNPDDPGDSTTLGSSSWHGTHVAGTVAAKSDNNVGVAGVSWGAKIMPIRALGSYGGTTYDLIQAVRYAAGLSNDSGTVPEKTADIINLSLGGPSYSAVESALYQQVYDMGIIVVAAAGNESTSAPSYPASYEGVISVSALDANNDLASYSNFGNKIDIAAPGGDISVDATGDGQPDGILSTLIDDSSGTRQGVIAFYQGTSMASPHVAGMFALMKAVHPALSAASVASLLQNGSLTDEAGQTGRDDLYGYGIANALKAVQSAQLLAGDDQELDLPASIVASSSNLNFGELSVHPLSIDNEGGGSPSVSSIQTSDTWLSLVAVDTASDGLGDYRVEVDRSDLSDGLYIGEITFNFEGANALSLSVSMTVGTIETQGELASIYVLVVDPDTNEVVAQAQASDNGDGTASYSVPEVPAGSYIIYAGSDIDNDLVISQSGEALGAYKSLAELIPIDVNGVDREELDFSVDIISGFDSLTQNIQSIQRVHDVGQSVKAEADFQLIRN